MQLRTMTLQAIGPFAGSHTVDFAALSSSGLFLLEGPTGSGKSTLIDAVVFALYGKVASDEASDDRLRSAFAAEDTESFVDLTFEVASGIYRVRRTPAYDRAKKRGSGTVRQQASVRLWRVAPDDVDGEPASVPVTRLDEAGLEIERAVGLSRTQFVQTIVLPQGEFSKFLRAKPEDRRGLLQKIFGTEVYERMQQRLVELRAQVARDVEAARGAVLTATAQLVGAVRLPDDEAVALRDEVSALAAAAASGGPDLEAITALMNGRTTALTEQADADRSLAQAAGARRDAAAAVLAEQTRLANLITRRSRLAAEQEELDRGQEAHVDGVARLDRARAAGAVRPMLDALDRSLADVGAARKGLLAAADAAPSAVAATVREVVAGLGDGDGLHGVGPDGLLTRGAVDLLAPRRLLVELRNGAADDAAALDRVVGLEAALNDKRRAVRDSRDQADTLRDQIAADDAWLAARPAERDELLARLSQATSTASRAGEHRARVATLEAAAAAHLELERLEGESSSADATRAAAGRAAQDAVGAEAALRAARIAGLAGELAQALGDGESCPVCGAVEHPHKASLAQDHPTADAVERAEQARVSAERTLARAGEAAAALTSRVEAACDALGDSTAEQVVVELTAAAADLAAARAAEATGTELAGALDAHAMATEARTAERATSVAQLADVQGRIGVLQQALAEDEAEVSLACAGHPTVVARRSELRDLVHAADDLVAALDDLAAADKDVAVRATELDAALVERGFSSTTDVTAALLDRPATEVLADAVAAYAGAVEAVRAGLADPDVAGLPDGAVADVAGARTAEQEAQEALVVAEARSRSTAERAAAVADAARTVLTAAHRLAAVWAEGGPVTRLAGLASGTGSDNGRGLSLATYVLARRFEDVVAAANDRLLGMSDGRYELVRSEQKEDVGSRRTGLAMRVVDHWTDQQRDPRTLSGGESFYVSLCLALGLADVVTAEAGGIDLGTLFVDEGFGSLDPHALEQVLAELGRLRAGGRVVGVVSHVEALKASIADRIEVRPGADGPSTLRVLAS